MLKYIEMGLYHKDRANWETFPTVKAWQFLKHKKVIVYILNFI